MRKRPSLHMVDEEEENDYDDEAEQASAGEGGLRGANDIGRPSELDADVNEPAEFPEEHRLDIRSVGKLSFPILSHKNKAKPVRANALRRPRLISEKSENEDCNYRSVITSVGEVAPRQ